MKNKIELLAPGGDLDAIKAAIIAGADAVYCGLDRFNARSRATNLRLADLTGILNLVHSHNCQIFLTLNIIIVEREIPAVINLLNKLVISGIDGIIIQDLGLFYLISRYFKTLKIHASTQLTTHNAGQILFLERFATQRVNLSRELNINEIKVLTLAAHQVNLMTEIFVHGSYCISFSGICYMSSAIAGKSGNRGRCSQPCRDRYLTTPEGKNYPLNLKDNSAYSDLREISDAGVDSIKIEGRIKKSDFVYTVVNCWKKHLEIFYRENRVDDENGDLYKVFNRDFSNSFLKGEIGKSAFIDNPRDNSISHISAIKQDQEDIYTEKSEIKSQIADKIKLLNIAKTPLIINISGELDTPLKVSVIAPDSSFTVVSAANLTKSDSQSINQTIILTRLKALNNSEYYIKQLNLDNLQRDLFIPFQELTALKNKIMLTLNGSKQLIEQAKIPVLIKQNYRQIKPRLAVLISSVNDLYFCEQSSADIYFQLPSCFKNEYSEFVDLFIKNIKIIPWFPSIMIGDDYSVAVEFLDHVKPKLIVTDNTGIAFAAYKRGISWIAGPHLNIVNSYSILCLKENFNCSGAFISNEISKTQIKNIICPNNFQLYYSIYHPILLMTSRQCLFHQVVGCEKSRIDDKCISECSKSASITNLNNDSFFIDKVRGNYHQVYNHHNFLNTNIVSDLPGMFSSFLVDLRDVKTATKFETDKVAIVRLFRDLLNGNPDSKPQLEKVIRPATCGQYVHGI